MKRLRTLHRRKRRATRVIPFGDVRIFIPAMIEAWCDGWLAGGGSPETLPETVKIVREQYKLK